MVPTLEQKEIRAPSVFTAGRSIGSRCHAGSRKEGRVDLFSPVEV